MALARSHPLPQNLVSVWTSAVPLKLAVILGACVRTGSGCGLLGSRSLHIKNVATTSRWSTPSNLPCHFWTRCTRNTAPAGPRPLERLAGVIRQADAYVIVSGEYNH